MAVEIATTKKQFLQSLLLLVLGNNIRVISSFSHSPSLSARLSIGNTSGNNLLFYHLNNNRIRRHGSPYSSLSRRFRFPSSSLSSLSSIKNYESISQDTNEMKSLGEKLIMQAALQCGATEPMIRIDWKADRIVVTVDVTKDDNYVDDYEDDDEDTFDGDEDFMDGDYDGDDNNMIDFLEEGDDIVYDDDDDDDDDDALGMDTTDLQEDFVDNFDYETTASDFKSNNNRIDLSRIARTINELLARDGEDSLSYAIAKLHEIEVTTPEFDNILRGKRMFESYKGFDVTVEYWEEEKKKKGPKGKSPSQKIKDGNLDDCGDGIDGDEPRKGIRLKTAEGKLIERDYEKEITLLNIKGRVAKIPNDTIERVYLPKAKREKGVK